MVGAFKFIGIILVLAGLPFLLFFNWVMGVGMFGGGVMFLLLTAGRSPTNKGNGATE